MAAILVIKLPASIEAEAKPGTEND
jgi:hypothetical protein